MHPPVGAIGGEKKCAWKREKKKNGKRKQVGATRDSELPGRVAMATAGLWGRGLHLVFFCELVSCGLVIYLFFI